VALWIQPGTTSSGAWSSGAKRRQLRGGRSLENLIIHGLSQGARGYRDRGLYVRWRLVPVSGCHILDRKKNQSIPIIGVQDVLVEPVLEDLDSPHCSVSLSLRYCLTELPVGLSVLYSGCVKKSLLTPATYHSSRTGGLT
jgi:hypothetical protein